VDYVDVPLRVRYADTDQMGIVYYGSYPVYFEVARSEFMRERGLTYRQLEDMGYFLVVAGMEVRYKGTAAYDDLLSIRTSVTDIQSRGVTFQYLVLRDGLTVVEGKTRHICVSAERKPRRLPPFLLEILRNGHSQ